MDDEQMRAALHAAEDAGMWSDDPACEWCGVVVEDGRSAFAPYCSEACWNDADTEAALEAGTAAEPEWDGGEEQGK